MENYNITIIGCGGTGGYVAEGLCRLLIGSDVPILLIDHDRVEEHNLGRQHFYPGDVGKFKSQALAERLARQYGRMVGYSVYPFMPDLMEDAFARNFHQMAVRGLVIGCVDNAEARKMINMSLDRTMGWWLDSGNGLSSGQVLFGSTGHVNQLQGAFHPGINMVAALPSPALQQPALLVPSADPRPVVDCSEAVMTLDQDPVINQAMASLVLQFVYKFLREELAWMGAYIDLEAGTMQTIPAEPETVARMLGVKVDTLMHKTECSIGRRYSMGGYGGPRG